MRETINGFWITVLLSAFLFQIFQVIQISNYMGKESTTLSFQDRFKEGANILRTTFQLALDLNVPNASIKTASTQELKTQDTDVSSLCPNTTEDVDCSETSLPVETEGACVLMGPVTSDDMDTQVRYLIASNEQEFIDRVKSYQFFDKKLHHIVTDHKVDDSQSPQFLEKMVAANAAMEKITFLDNGLVWVNTFADELAAQNYVDQLKKSGVNTIIIPENRNDIYYYLINPSLEEVAKFNAFAALVANIKVKETECFLSDSQKAINDKLGIEEKSNSSFISLD